MFRPFGAGTGGSKSGCDVGAAFPRLPNVNKCTNPPISRGRQGSSPEKPYLCKTKNRVRRLARPIFPPFLPIMNGHILSRDNTLWMQGVSALLIMLMHFVMQIDGYPRILNILGSIGVAVFLFVSGYGLNESYKIHGIKGFWRKRLVRVILPCWAVYLLQLPYREHFDAGALLHNLTFTGSDLWFVDCILRWYLVYWIARSFIPKYTTPLLFAFAVCNIFQQQLYSEQAFSFVCGYLASLHIDRLSRMGRTRILRYSGIAVAYGIAFYLLKQMPCIQQVKGTLPFNLILLNIKLPLAAGVIALPYLVPAVRKGGILQKFGKISYELYIVHYNFMPFVTGVLSVVQYSACSVLISAVFRRLNVLLARKGHFMQGFACYLLAGICYVLMCKYAMRATDHVGYVCITYVTVMVAVVLFISSRYFKVHENTRLFWPAMIAFAVVLLLVQYHFDPMLNKVDRWSAIANPITYLLHGEFPYMAKTHLGGNASPFPVWILFHLPFYFLGNVGLSEIFTALLFVYSVKRLYGCRAAVKSIILLTLCINLWYEVAVRSDLISNFLLLAAFTNFLQARRIGMANHPWALAVCVGLWMSTRLSVTFPLFVLLLPGYLGMDRKKQILTPCVAAGVFALTFLPLVIWDAAEMFGAANNPFVLQLRQGSMAVTLCLVLTAVALALTWRGNYSRWLLHAAVILLLVPVVSYVRSMYVYGNWTEIFQPAYDITYIDAAIPFLVTLLARGKEDAPA